MTQLPPNISYAALARQLGRHYSTVYNWFKYGIPRPEREGVRKAIEKLSQSSAGSQESVRRI